MSADLIFSDFKKEKIYHLAATDKDSVDLLQNIIRHWTIEDLTLTEPDPSVPGSDMVCIVDLHLKTVNSKLSVSSDDFGFQCAQFAPMVRFGTYLRVGTNLNCNLFLFFIFMFIFVLWSRSKHHS